MTVVPIWGKRSGSQLRHPDSNAQAVGSGILNTTVSGSSVAWTAINEFAFDTDLTSAYFYFGRWNIHSALERIVGDDNEFIRMQSMCHWQDAGGATAGEDRKAWFGFFNPIDPNDPDGYAGVGWYADLEEGYLYTVVADAPYGSLPVNYRKKTRTAFRCRLAVDFVYLGVRVNGQTRSVEFFHNGELVDWFTIPDEGYLGPTGNAPYAMFGAVQLRDSAASGNGNLTMYTHGDGDAFALSLGQFEVGDSLVLPDTPTLTEFQTSNNSTTIDSSTLTPVSLEHLATQWRITLSTDASFSDPVEVTGWVCGAQRLRYSFLGLSPETTYIVQARHGSTSGVSEWSESLEITTLAGGGDPGGGDPVGGFSSCIDGEAGSWSGCS